MKKIAIALSMLCMQTVSAEAAEVVPYNVETQNGITYSALTTECLPEDNTGRGHKDKIFHIVCNPTDYTQVFHLMKLLPTSLSWKIIQQQHGIQTA